MTQLGYGLSSEELRPRDMVRYARMAEDAGFPFGLISDHFHPWIDAQGQSPFVWNVIGGIATATERFRLGTGVTCPMMRIHPAVIAQAAATSASMMPGRFFLGVGTGENLNEHVLGDAWPAHETRTRMLEEAVEVMRRLWEGGQQDFEGEFFTVDRARIYTLPEEPIEVYVAASGPKAGALAGRIGDGLIVTAPKKEVVQAFRKEAGRDKPIVGQATVCWAPDLASARKTAHHMWPTAGIPGEATQELPSPAHFEQLAELVTEDSIAEKVVCGPDPEPYIAKIREYVDAGIDQVYLHQVGTDQEGFIDFARRELMPAFAERKLAAARA